MEALNRRGSASLAVLHEATGLPKPTLVRLLDTLIEGGYVVRLPRRGGYQVAERVLRLSGGFRHRERVVDAARPFLSALTAQYKWSFGIATLDRNAMRMRYSTRQQSPFDTDPDYTNRRLPMLISALGRAYISFCPEEEREMLLGMLRASKSPANAPARDEAHVADIIKKTRQKGYASTAPLPGDPAMGMSVPVMNGDNVMACITMRYINSAIGEQEAVKRYLPALQRASRAIAAALADEEPDLPPMRLSTGV
ncbi:IclR family mhp operon transcriptional activator [Parvibaculum indicum]|nr:IclR family mhp operon transcriptional activator [Parvibaculum indicum]